MDNYTDAVRRLVFVGGSPRSGTTLVQRLLNCHPQVYGGPEFDFVPQIAELYGKMYDSIRSGRIDCIVEEATLSRAFRGLLVSLLTPKADAKGVRILSEKTPGNVLAFDILDRLAPEAKKIMVIRDPRDVIYSMLEVGWRERKRCGSTGGFVRDVTAAVSYLNKCLSSGAAAAGNSSNFMVVYYEDVIASPLAESNRLYAFLGLEPIDRLDFETVEFDAARDKASWTDWYAPDLKPQHVMSDRIGVAQTKLTGLELSYIAAKIISHPLINQRYNLDDHISVARARWCSVTVAVRRLREDAGAVPALVRRKLFQ
jgi:hypothetical protein